MHEIHQQYFSSLHLMERISRISLKNLILVLSIIAAVSLFIPSCKKYTGPETPVITLLLPRDTSIINAGDTISIKGSASDNKDLHEIYFTIKNTTNDSIYVYVHPYVHGLKIFNFSYLWITVDSSIYKLTIEAQDHDNHSTKKEIMLTVN